MPTAGGNMLAYYGTCCEPTEEEQQKVFNMMMEAGLILVINIVHGLLGGYGLQFIMT